MVTDVGYCYLGQGGAHVGIVRGTSDGGTMMVGLWVLIIFRFLIWVLVASVCSIWEKSITADGIFACMLLVSKS